MPEILAQQFKDCLRVDCKNCGQEHEVVKEFSLKTKKALVPALASVIVAVVNATVDLNDCKHVPTTIMVK